MAPNKIALRVFQTVLELVDTRGYVIPDEAKVDSVLQFSAKYVGEQGSLSNMSRLFKHKSDNKSMYVFFCANQGEEYTPCKNDIKNFIDAIEENNDKNTTVTWALFISEIPLSTTNLKLLDTKSICDKRTSFQTYLFDELLFNPTKHVLVPQHRLLSDKEQDDLYKSFGSTLVDPRPVFKATKSHKDNVMPILRVKNIHSGDMTKNEEIGDPIAKWYGASPGDVFEITRKNIFHDTTIRKSVVYKYVVS